MGSATVVGLDLSLTATGIAPQDMAPYTLRFGNRKSSAKGDLRLARIRDEVENVIICPTTGNRASLVMIEALPPYGTGTKALGLVHGVVREVCVRHWIPVGFIAPSSLKLMATGSGSASKEQMKEAMRRLVGDRLDHLDDNAVDAFFLRELGLFKLTGTSPSDEWVDRRDVRDKIKLKD